MEPLTVNDLIRIAALDLTKDLTAKDKLKLSPNLKSLHEKLQEDC